MDSRIGDRQTGRLLWADSLPVSTHAAGTAPIQQKEIAILSSTAHAARENLQLVARYAFFFRKLSLFSPTPLLSAERSGGAYAISVPFSPTFLPVLLNNTHEERGTEEHVET